MKVSLKFFKSENEVILGFSMKQSYRRPTEFGHNQATLICSWKNFPKLSVDTTFKGKKMSKWLLNKLEFHY